MFPQFVTKYNYSGWEENVLVYIGIMNAFTLAFFIVNINFVEVDLSMNWSSAHRITILVFTEAKTIFVGTYNTYTESGLQNTQMTVKGGGAPSEYWGRARKRPRKIKCTRFVKRYLEAKGVKTTRKTDVIIARPLTIPTTKFNCLGTHFFWKNSLHSWYNSLTKK